MCDEQSPAQPVDDDPTEIVAAVLEGVADIEAGRVYPLAEVFDQIRQQWHVE